MNLGQSLSPDDDQSQLAGLAPVLYQPFVLKDAKADFPSWYTEPTVLFSVPPLSAQSSETPSAQPQPVSYTHLTLPTICSV